MVNFKIIYSSNKFEFNVKKETTILEIKMNLMGMLDLNIEDFEMLLENVGLIDLEEMLELPLECLDLGIYNNNYF